MGSTLPGYSDRVVIREPAPRARRRPCRTIPTSPRCSTPERAPGWYGATVRDLEIMSLAYYGPAELRSAEVLTRLGRTAEARRRYRRFLELWGQADRSLLPIVEEARERLAELGA